MKYLLLLFLLVGCSVENDCQKSRDNLKLSDKEILKLKYICSLGNKVLTTAYKEKYFDEIRLNYQCDNEQSKYIREDQYIVGLEN